MRWWVLAAVLAYGTATAQAQEARVRFVFSSPSVGTFEHQVTVQGSEAHRLATPSPADLKPYLVAAQKALAEREGYSERMYGPNNGSLASGKLVESTVSDAGGRVLYSSRDPAEDRARERRMVRPIRTFEADAEPTDVVGFAPVSGSRARRSAVVVRLPAIRR
jgi:hypothetical protein